MAKQKEKGHYLIKDTAKVGGNCTHLPMKEAVPHERHPSVPRQLGGHFIQALAVVKFASHRGKGLTHNASVHTPRKSYFQLMQPLSTMRTDMPGPQYPAKGWLDVNCRDIKCLARLYVVQNEKKPKILRSL